MANGLNERKYMSLLEDNKTAAESDINTPHGQVVAGYYTTAAPTLTNTDFGFLRLTSDGKLMVDTELTVDGNVIVDNVAVWATNIADSSTAGFALIDASGHAQVDIISGTVTSTSAGDVAHDSVDSGNPVKIGLNAQDPTSLPAAVAVADRVNAIGDVYGRQVVYLGTSLDATNDEVSVTPRDTSHNNTTAYATNLVVKASAGKLFEIRGYNSLASVQFIQVHDAASLPADTTVPEEVFTVSASSNFSISFPQGKVFSTGIVICNSSTGPTKTIGAADCWFSSDFE